MPRRDGTGPMGMGAITGKGAGLCAGLATVGSVGAGCVRGFRKIACGQNGKAKFRHKNCWRHSDIDGE